MASESRSAADAIEAMCAVDGRPGAPALWSAVVRRAIDLQRALRRCAGGAEDEAEAAAVGALEEMFVAPARRLGDARNGVLVTPGGDDVGLAVQAPTEIHRELAVACAGGGDAETWRPAVAAWARRRRASEAASELQDWGVPAVAVRLRRRPQRIADVVTRPRSGPRLEGVRVIEMGGLWAAPYAAQLLRGLGAEVIKIEAPMRPDGTRFGPIAHFEALNAGKQMLALDLRRDADREHAAWPGRARQRGDRELHRPRLGEPRSASGDDP